MTDIKLEIGKTYRSRRGDVVTIATEKLGENGKVYLFQTEGGDWWLPNGRLMDERDTHLDLIEDISHLFIPEGYYWVVKSPVRTAEPVHVIRQDDQMVAYRFNTAIPWPIVDDKDYIHPNNHLKISEIGKRLEYPGDLLS